MDIQIPQSLQYLILSLILFSDKVIKIKFSEDYNNKEIISPFTVKDLSNSLRKLEKKVKTAVHLTNEEYNALEDLVCSSTLDKDIEDTKQSTKIKDKREVTVNKYSQNRKGDLCESIILNGEPVFLSINDNSESTFPPFLEEKTRILYPPSEDEYLHQPYEFGSEEEIRNIINLARKETTFTLFKRGRLIASKYIDQEIHMKNLVSVDLIFSYFQDRFNTVHYTGIFGDNGTGKSSIGDVVEALAYRAFNTTDPTAPNIFRSLGNVEPGQVTLILDEAEKVDQSVDMIGILKSGYAFNKKVSRINPNTGKPELFFAYCQKMIIGERPPSPNIAKGVNERILGDVVYFGTPQYDIKEILNPTDTGGEEFKEALREIVEFRKLLFIYRMLHFNDHIRNIDVGLSGRNKELVKPYLQLFSNYKTEEEKETYHELENTFHKLLEIKNNKKDFSLESALIPIIIELMKESKDRKIKFSDFWEKLKSTIKGKINENKPNEYNTEDHGTIYRSTITNTLQKLGVSTKHHNSYTELFFDHKKIKKTASQYGFVVQEKISEFSNKIGERSERSECSIEPSVENNHTLDEKQSDNSTEIGILDTDNCETKGKNELKDTFWKATDVSNERPDVIEPSQHAPRSPEEEELENKIINNIYRIGKTDTWNCKNCKLRGDKWFMQKHPCRGA